MPKPNLAAVAPPSEEYACLAAHQAAIQAWLGATTAQDVEAARNLSRSAAELAGAQHGNWREQLEAALFDAEADYAADLHAQAISDLQSRMRVVATGQETAGQ